MVLRARQRLGKYRIVRRLAQGGFAQVYEALDTVEGVRVALKVPDARHVSREMLELFRREVRVTSSLDHPAILPIKNADLVEGRFVVAQPLARGSLADRLRRRLSAERALDYADQLLEALAYAHSRRVIHCDVKPENILLFDDDRLRLADFGIAKVALRTISAAGTGTIGFIAPEQAMGRPSPRSDVFSAGLVIWRMLTGRQPTWPFAWPLDGVDRLRRFSKETEVFLRKSLRVPAESRYRDAEQMLAAWERLRPRVLRPSATQRRRKATPAPTGRDWEQLQRRECKRRFGRRLDLAHDCARCGGPVSEAMTSCPWCGTARKRHKGEVSRPAQCPRCRRGLKLDWTYCPWCYGAAVGPLSDRTYSDRRYTGRCPDKRCGGRGLLRFMRYSPWCRVKLKQAWTFDGASDRCDGCRWGVLGEYWSWCPWCGRKAARRNGRGARRR